MNTNPTDGEAAQTDEPEGSCAPPCSRLAATPESDALEFEWAGDPDARGYREALEEKVRELEADRDSESRWAAQYKAERDEWRGACETAEKALRLVIHVARRNLPSPHPTIERIAATLPENGEAEAPGGGKESEV